MPNAGPDAAPESFLTGLSEGFLSGITEFIGAHPLAAAALGGLLLIVLVTKLNARLRTVAIDPTRLFSAVQRTEGFARAGGQCELEGWLFTRCKRKASHGDHHYPHSRGGATSMGNFVAACAKCNTSKGAKIPTAWATARMEARRRRYFGEGLPVKAGERFIQH